MIKPNLTRVEGKREKLDSDVFVFPFPLFSVVTVLVFCSGKHPENNR